MTYKLTNFLYGTSTFDVEVENNGGTANGGSNTSNVTAFTILANPRVGWTVNTTTDTAFDHMADGVPVDANGNTSLRAAVQAGNMEPVGTTVRIDFAAGLGATINLGIALPALNRNFRISGPGATSLTIQPLANAGAFRVFTVNLGTDVLIRGLTIAGGAATGAGILGYGGGILNMGHLELYGDFLDHNDAMAGGAVFNSSGGWTGAEAELLIFNCQLYLNTATDGGAIANAGDAWIGGATQIFVNTATRDGGGVWNAERGTLLLTGGVQIYSNIAQFWGGGIMNYGDFYASNLTFYENTAGAFGGGLFSFSGTALLTDVTFDTNNATLRRGGGFYIRAGSVTMVNPYVTGNTSGDGSFNGGAYAAGLEITFVSPQWNNQSVNPDNMPPQGR